MPYVKSGSLHVGKDFNCGNNVVIDVAEEVILGDRCVLADNTYLGGRRIEIGDDFYGYTWEWKRLDIGRSRSNCEFATLKIGHRCTLHDNFIDLSKPVIIGNDVGLSPQVYIYTHGYWQSVLEGFPASYKPVEIGDNTIVGFRSTILAGAKIGPCSVIGAHSLVCGTLEGSAIYGGSPAKMLRKITDLTLEQKVEQLNLICEDYHQTLSYRRLPAQSINVDYPMLKFRLVEIDIETRKCLGEEDDYTDDLRDFLFRRGIRIFTQRPFKRLK